MKKTAFLKKHWKLLVTLLLFLVILLGGYFLRDWQEELKLRRSARDFNTMQQEVAWESEKESYAETKEILRIAIIGDTHLGAWYLSGLRLAQALQRAQEKGADFAVLLGDLTQNGKKAEFKELIEIIDASSLDCYLVPGNHDVGKESLQDEEDNGEDNFFKVFGALDKEIVRSVAANEAGIERVRLYLLNTARWRDNSVLLDNKQWQWLRTSLAYRGYDKKELRLMFSQMPLDSMSLTDSHYLREYLCEGFIDGLFQANSHKTEFYQRQCPLPLYDEMLAQSYYSFSTFEVGSLFKPFREFPGFLMVHFFSNRFSELERVIFQE